MSTHAYAGQKYMNESYILLPEVSLPCDSQHSVVMILLKLCPHNSSKIPLVIDAEVRVQELTVMGREDKTSWRSDSYLWETLIT